MAERTRRSLLRSIALTPEPSFDRKAKLALVSIVPRERCKRLLLPLTIAMQSLLLSFVLAPVVWIYELLFRRCLTFVFLLVWDLHRSLGNDVKRGNSASQSREIRRSQAIGKHSKIRNSMNVHRDRYAITFGEVVVSHIGGKEVGVKAKEGFTVEELQKIPGTIHIVSDALPEEHRSENLAAVLVVKDGVRAFGVDPDALLAEQKKVAYDKFFFDRGRKKNKLARHNIVFGDVGIEHDEEYRQPTVVSFEDVPHLRKFREKIPVILGSKSVALNAEGNHYYARNSGIGYHGDMERKKVVCVSLGTPDVLRFRWRMPGSSDNAYGMDIPVSHGDVYVMSEKATGWDWRRRSKVRVVHAAGARR